MPDAKPLIVDGVVTRFAGDGRKLGYPTANITTDTEARDGVYFGYADLAGFSHHPSLIFVGIPTTMGETTRRVEAHLLDIADEDQYGQTLRLQLIEYHRPNQTFAGVQELKAVMAEDEKAARSWFAARTAAPVQEQA